MSVRVLTLGPLALVCTGCGAQYTTKHLEQWGRSAESAGYGPSPCCVELVKDPLGSNAVCRGQLMGVTITKEQEATLTAERTPTPIVATAGRNNQ